MLIQVSKLDALVSIADFLVVKRNNIGAIVAVFDLIFAFFAQNNRPAGKQ
jgi:hypothetical protein